MLLERINNSETKNGNICDLKAGFRMLRPTHKQFNINDY